MALGPVFPSHLSRLVGSAFEAAAAFEAALASQQPAVVAHHNHIGLPAIVTATNASNAFIGKS
jgi:hypothetical protein